MTTISYIKENNKFKELTKDHGDLSASRLSRLNDENNGEQVSDVASELRKVMQKHCGVFRFPDLLEEGVAKIYEIAERCKKTTIKDKSKVFNTARVEALELDNLIEVAVSSLVSANARKEVAGS